MPLIMDLQQQNERDVFDIAFGSKWSVKGVLQTDLSIAGSNDFMTAKEAMSDLPIVGKVLEIKDKFSNVFQISGRSSITDFESRLIWNNSSKPQFVVDYKFVNTSNDAANNERLGALHKALQLQACVLPTRGKPAIGRKGYFFRSPLGYRFKIQGASGTLSLQIGKWFRATGLVAMATNFVPSRETMKDGQPLEVVGSITLEPFQASTYKQFLGYFRR